MATLSIEIPMNPLFKSMTFLREHASPYINAAKDSPRLPDIIKPHLDTPCTLVTKYIDPVLKKCDSKLEHIIPGVNDKIATVAHKVDPYVQTGMESYSEGGFHKVANDIYAQIMDPKSPVEGWAADECRTDVEHTKNYDSDSDTFSILSDNDLVSNSPGSIHKA